MPDRALRLIRIFGHQDCNKAAVRKPPMPDRALRRQCLDRTALQLQLRQKTPNARQGITTDIFDGNLPTLCQKTPNARQGITTPIFFCVCFLL